MSFLLFFNWPTDCTLAGVAASGTVGGLSPATSANTLVLTGVSATGQTMALGGGTFSRASSATYLDPAGEAILSVGNDVPRPWYDPTYGLLGTLLEPAATNILPSVGTGEYPFILSGPSGAGIGTDAVVIGVSEDYYLDDARFTVSIDSVQQGGTYFTTTLNVVLGVLTPGSSSQYFVFCGNWGIGSHTVNVNFLNDAYGGSPSTDRNFFVNSLYYNGVNTNQSWALLSNGSHNFTVTDTTAVAATPSLYAAASVIKHTIAGNMDTGSVQLFNGVQPSSTYTASVWIYIPSANYTSAIMPWAYIDGLVTANGTSAASTFDNWQRLSVTFTTPSVISSAIGFGINAATTAGNFFYSTAWQIELGTSPTSFVLTSNVPATRAADLLSAAGIITVFASLGGVEGDTAVAVIRTSPFRVPATGVSATSQIGHLSTSPLGARATGVSATSQIGGYRPPVTLNASDVTPTLALSNGNLTVTATQTTSDITARATVGITSGKFCFEATSVAIGDKYNFGYGISNQLEPLDTYIGASNNSLGFYMDGSVWPPSISSTSDIAVGVTLLIAVDADHGKVWVYNSGLWNQDVLANQNPATNTGGWDISAVLAGGPIYPAFTCDTVGDKATFNFGATTFFNLSAFNGLTGFRVWPNWALANVSQALASVGGSGQAASFSPEIDVRISVAATLYDNGNNLDQLLADTLTAVTVSASFTTNRSGYLNSLALRLFTP